MGQVRKVRQVGKASVFSPTSPTCPYLGDDERYSQGGLIRKETVRKLPVVAQSFAMIASDDHQSRSAPRSDLVQQRREGRIGRSDLAEIRLAGVPSIER